MHIFTIRAALSKLVTRWRNNPRPLLHDALLVFLAADFVLSPEPLWADLFYCIVLPLTLRTAWFELARHGAFLGASAQGVAKKRTPIWACCTQYWHSLPKITQIGCVLTFWVAIALIWDTKIHAQPMLAVFWVGNVFFTLTFILGLSDALCHGMRFRKRLVTALIGAGLANMAITFARLPFLFHTFWSGTQLRITGWGATRHQIIGAIIIGFIVLLAFNRLCRAVSGTGGVVSLASVRGAKSMSLWCYVVMALVGLLFMVMTGSRGPEIGIAVALPVLLLWVNPRIAVLFIGGVAGLVTLFAVSNLNALEHFWAAAMERGDSSRIAIWRMSWAAIQQHPLLGYGPTYLLPRIHNESFPHNLFLSTWVYTGVVGLGLLLACIVAAIWRALCAHAAQRPIMVCALLYMIMCGMTDLSQIARGPSLIWYIFWVPVLYAASIPTGRSAKAGNSQFA